MVNIKFSNFMERPFSMDLLKILKSQRKKMVTLKVKVICNYVLGRYNHIGIM